MKALILVGSLCALLASAQAATINGTLWLSVLLASDVEGFGGPEEDFKAPTDFAHISLLYTDATGTYEDERTFPVGTFPLDGIYNFTTQSQSLPSWWGYTPSPDIGFSFDVTSMHFNFTPSIFSIWGNGIAYGTGYTPTRATYHMRGVAYNYDSNFHYVVGEFIASGKSAVPDSASTIVLLFITLGGASFAAHRLAPKQ